MTSRATSALGGAIAFTAFAAMLVYGFVAFRADVLREADRLAASEKAEDLPRAIEKYDEVIERAARAYEGKARAHLRLAEALLARDLLGAAEVELRKVLELRPTDAEAMLTLAAVVAHVSQADPARREEARRLYEAAARLAPDRAEPLYGLGMLEEADENLRAARRAYEEAIRRDPSYAPAHAALGRLAYREGDPLRAYSHYQKAAASEPAATPRRAEILKTLSRLAEELGLTDEAQK